jgi:hypothetical protein
MKAPDLAPDPNYPPAPRLLGSTGRGGLDNFYRLEALALASQKNPSFNPNIQLAYQQVLSELVTHAPIPHLGLSAYRPSLSTDPSYLAELRENLQTLRICEADRWELETRVRRSGGASTGRTPLQPLEAHEIGAELNAQLHANPKYRRVVYQQWNKWHRLLGQQLEPTPADRRIDSFPPETFGQISPAVDYHPHGAYEVPTPHQPPAPTEAPSGDSAKASRPKLTRMAYAAILHAPAAHAATIMARLNPETSSVGDGSGAEIGRGPVGQSPASPVDIQLTQE